MRFPVLGGGFWVLPKPQLEAWKKKYPHLEVEKDLGKALLYLETNPDKIRAGTIGFLEDWLNKCRGNGKPMSGEPRASLKDWKWYRQGPLAAKVQREVEKIRFVPFEACAHAAYLALKEVQDIPPNDRQERPSNQWKPDEALLETAIAYVLRG